MTIYQISIDGGLSNLNRPTQPTGSMPRRLSAGKGNTPSGNAPAESVAVNQTHYNFTKLQAVNTTFNALAANIRFADRTMETAEKKINRMETELRTHVKNFPPFPPGSEARIKLLRNFSLFRKQIDQLNIPPDSDYALDIISDSSHKPESGVWEVVVGENGPRKAIHCHEIHTGPTGLDIPGLPENASDDRIETAIFKMGNAKGVVKRARATLSRDSSEMSHLKGYITPIGDMPEFAAEHKSIEVKHALASESGTSLTGTQSQLVHLLK
jgi:hypothetical protein